MTIGIELICSEQSIQQDLPRWCGEKADALNFIGTTNLFYNGSVFVRSGLGCMLTFDRLADTGADSPLCFRPLYPKLENRMYIIWKKYQVFTPIAERFIKFLTEQIKKPVQVILIEMEMRCCAFQIRCGVILRQVCL